MNRTIVRAALAALLAGTFALAGCTTATNAGHPTDGVWGYVASAESAQLELAASQPGAAEISVDRVLAPGGAWVVVHLDVGGKPGMRVGLLYVPEGESTDVRVPLEDVTTDSVIVALHADRGELEVFDFDMDAPTTSPDRPYFVDGQELAAIVGVK